MNRVLVLALAALAAAADVIWAFRLPGLASSGSALAMLALGLGGGWSFVAGGLVTRAIRPAGRTGTLMTAVGTTLLLSGVNYHPARPAMLAGNVLGWAALAVLAHLVLVVPDGRAAGRAERAMVAAVYLGLAIALAVWLRFGRLGDGSCVCLPALPGGDGPSRLLTRGLAGFLWVFGLVLTGVLVRRWLVRMPAPRRHTFAPVALAGALMLLATWGRQGVYLWLGDSVARSPLETVLHFLQLSTLVLWPLGVLAGLLRARLDHAAVARIAASLPPDPGMLEATLATVLRDPTLRLGHPDENGGYADAAGRPARWPDAAHGRSAALLEVDGEPAAVLSYDAALDDDPEPIRSAAAIVRLVLENERMRARLAARLAEVRESRARIVTAGDAERRRIERNLHDGAQQRLARLTTTLGLARARNSDEGLAGLLDEAAADLRHAMTELRELAGGIHPAILREAGLRAALASLADRSPVPVTVEAPEGRLPAAAEQAAYFVAAEALANAAKHAGASHVSITAALPAAGDGTRLRLEIRDDGVGGARAESGTGLRGLADRVAALDGGLLVDSPPGRGTRVTAEIPLGRPDPAEPGRGEPQERR
ncbi:sensor histidine kinase [Spirillospora sp. CA-142024]|uniref:sensor histidine kinase n=1 Tax=Spirillospora sp. CA-142024 TaxID=3240036 RepID=UPI003D8E9573